MDSHKRIVDDKLTLSAAGFLEGSEIKVGLDLLQQPPQNLVNFKILMVLLELTIAT
jgi:hypothetical protein